MGALGTYHTTPHTVPGVYRWLLGGGLTTNPRTGRNPTSDTFSGRAGSNNPFLLREQSACLFWHPSGCNALATPLCWPFAGSCSSTKGRPLQGAAPRSPGGPVTSPAAGPQEEPSAQSAGPELPTGPSPVVGTTVLRNPSLPAFPWGRRGRSWQGRLPGCSSNPLMKGNAEHWIPYPQQPPGRDSTQNSSAPQGGMCQDILWGW